MNKTLITIGLALLLLAINARAMNLTGSCNSVSVQCDLQIDYLTVCSEEGFTNTVYPQVFGGVPDWMKALPENITIEAGDCQQIELYMIAPCYAEPGNYSTNVSVDGKTISCNIELHQGHFIDIDIVPKEEAVPQCSTAEYEIILTNNTIVPNQEEELVNLSIGGLDPSWVNLETFQTIVRKGKPKSISMTVVAPCRQEIGKYDFEIKASLYNPNFFSTDKGTFTIFQGQKTDIEIEDTDFGAGTANDPVIACIEKERIVPVTVRNTGDKDDVFEITLEGPNWARLGTNTLEIRKGEEKEINLILSKTGDEQKNYTAQITFNSKIFNFSIVKELHLRLEDCYNALLDFPKGQENICNEEENTLVFKVKNDKSNPIDLKAEVEGIPAQLNQQNIHLGAFEEKEIRLNVNAQDLAKEGTASKKPVALEILFDASASMSQKIEGQRKIETAKNAILSFLNGIQPTSVGLRVFGHKEECSESEQLEAITEKGMINIPQKIKQFSPTGNTPLAKTLESAASDFEGIEGEKFIILVSDGKESCSGDIPMAARKLSGKGIVVYAVGFDIDETGKNQLEDIVRITGGTYFDARNSNELIKVMQEISKKLDIELSKTFEQDFTLRLFGNEFSIEKDFSINVSDCHNIAVFAPEINVCRGISGKTTASITNIGTKKQEIKINTEPGFVKATQQKISLESGQTAFVDLQYNPTDSSNEDKLTLTAVSENLSAKVSSDITYLDRTACVGFEMIILEPEFVGRIGEGARRKILLLNTGKTTMDIAMKGDQPWIYFEPNTVTLKENEVGFTNFYVTPPFDFNLLKEDSIAQITATNNHGISIQKEVKLVVTGPTFGLVPEKIEVEKADISKLPEGQVDKDFIVTFALSNQSNRTIEIRSVTTPGLSSSFQADKTVLKEGENAQATLLVDLGERTGKIKIPIVITTTDGSILREIEVEVKQEPEKEEEPQTPSGLFNLGNLAGTAAILAVILILLAIPVAVFFMLKLDQKKKENQAQHEKLKNEIESTPAKTKKAKPKKTSKKTSK